MAPLGLAFNSCYYFLRPHFCAFSCPLHGWTVISWRREREYNRLPPAALALSPSLSFSLFLSLLCLFVDRHTCNHHLRVTINLEEQCLHSCCLPLPLALVLVAGAEERQRPSLCLQTLPSSHPLVTLLASEPFILTLFLSPPPLSFVCLSRRRHRSTPRHLTVSAKLSLSHF